MTKEERNAIRTMLTKKSPDELFEKYDYFMWKLDAAKTSEEGMDASIVLAMIRAEMIFRMS